MTTDPLRPPGLNGGPMSVEEYLRLDRYTTNAKYEYLDGAARLMSGGSVGHGRIARNVAHFIDEHFRSGACVSIQEITLVSQFARHVEFYRRSEENETIWNNVLYRSDETVELACVDVFLTMDEIYRGIDFDEPLLEE